MAEAEGPSQQSHSLGGEACSHEEWEDVDAEVHTTHFEPSHCTKQSVKICCGNQEAPQSHSLGGEACSDKDADGEVFTLNSKPWPLICACMRLH